MPSNPCAMLMAAEIIDQRVSKGSQQDTHDQLSEAGCEKTGDFRVLQCRTLGCAAILKVTASNDGEMDVTGASDCRHVRRKVLRLPDNISVITPPR